MTEEYRKRVKEAIDEQQRRVEEDNASLPTFSNGLRIYRNFCDYGVKFGDDYFLRIHSDGRGGEVSALAWGEREDLINFVSSFESEAAVSEYYEKARHLRPKIKGKSYVDFRPGDKVKYIGPGFCFHSSVWQNHKKLEFGREYTLREVAPASSWTRVSLEEFPETDKFGEDWFSLSFFDLV
jgi:hypothetical protein